MDLFRSVDLVRGAKRKKVSVSRHPFYIINKMIITVRERLGFLQRVTVETDITVIVSQAIVPSPLSPN